MPTSTGESQPTSSSVRLLEATPSEAAPRDWLNGCLLLLGNLSDVRSFPGSRHNPQFGRQEMERWMPAAGIGYVWTSNLGGRRRPVEGSKHVALRHVSFRAYADYMETPDFLIGVEALLTLVGERSTAVM